MHSIMISCAQTGRAISTGIEIDPDRFARIPKISAVTLCPACGADHAWSKDRAWLCPPDPDKCA